MSDTNNLLVRIDMAADQAARATAQQGLPFLNTAQRHPAHPSEQARANNAPQENAEQTETDGHIPGVAYALSYDDAIQKGWSVPDARPEGRAGAFVYERETHTGSHKFVTPANLPDSFRVKSTLLEGLEDTEEWRTDIADGVEPTVFPNLDIVLANTGTSPLSFVQRVVDYGWHNRQDTVGPLAQLIGQHLEKATVRTRLTDTDSSPAILTLDVLLSFAQFEKGRQGETLWIGCPVLPQQLLTVIQRSIASQAGLTWRAPPLDQTVKIIGDLSQITDRARSLARAVVFRGSVDEREVHQMIVEEDKMKAAIQLLTTMTWEKACQVTDSTDLPTALDLLRQQAAQNQISGSAPQRSGWGGPIPGHSPAVPHTFMLAREPTEGEPQLTPEEREQLEEACRLEQTNQIDISRARILTEATGMAIVSLQPGGPDITRVRLGYFTEIFLKMVHREIASSSPLRKIPMVTLAKIMSLRMTPSDNFVFEHLGMLVCEDFSTEVGLTKMRGPTQGGQVIKAKKHSWATVETMEDFTNIVEGLAICVQRFHHPSIFDHHEIWALWLKLKQLLTEHGGQTHVPGLYLVFKARIEEHVLAIRKKTKDESQPLPPLTEFQSESAIIYRDVLRSAQQRCSRNYTALKAGLGETTYGAQRNANAGVDADGRRISYPRDKAAKTQPATATHPIDLEQPPALAGGSGTGKRARENENRPSSDRGSNRRRKRAPSPLNPCIKCGKPGHEWYACGEKGWCAIPSHWPIFLKTLATRKRAEYGVMAIYESAPPGETFPTKRTD